MHLRQGQGSKDLAFRDDSQGSTLWGLASRVRLRVKLTPGRGIRGTGKAHAEKCPCVCKAEVELGLAKAAYASQSLQPESAEEV